MRASGRGGFIKRNNFMEQDMGLEKAVLRRCLQIATPLRFESDARLQGQADEAPLGELLEDRNHNPEHRPGKF